MNAGDNQVQPRKICGIGAGILGVPTCAVLAIQCPEIQVHVVDEDQDLVTRWNSEYLPIDEVSTFINSISNFHIGLPMNIITFTDFWISVPVSP
ncbi:unnamed protein product [Dibothriocephalus latus]|uniref:UDP-glucose/GDP-mannose dehydrogenase N-terminal domain-containing protein n=1 Tax=Dibothriocephalus latus TaxID=60516 RepID=A0A3P7LXK5_DIBLA|nr:unnamed protein product [Dibothriocephalus latus]